MREGKAVCVCMHNGTGVCAHGTGVVGEAGVLQCAVHPLLSGRAAPARNERAIVLRCVAGGR